MNLLHVTSSKKSAKTKTESDSKKRFENYGLPLGGVPSVEC